MTNTDLKKGSAEFFVLFFVEREFWHGYELGKLIEFRSWGIVRFNVVSLYFCSTVSRIAGGSRGAGWRRWDSAVGATTTSPRGEKPGRAPLSFAAFVDAIKRIVADMPDWKPELQRHLNDLALGSAGKKKIVEELTQHLDDRYQLTGATRRRQKQGSS
jgi:hypothetical protein